jgi:hypothetical protein
MCQRCDPCDDSTSIPEGVNRQQYCVVEVIAAYANYGPSAAGWLFAPNSGWL